MNFLDSILDTFKGTLAAFQSAPLVVGAILVIGLLLIWAKYRFISASQRRAQKGLTAGWDAAAQTRQMPHETGIGTREVLVMRAANKPLGVGIFGMIFFGGGALFLWYGPMQEGDPGLKDWIGFLFCALFGLLSPAVIWLSFRRIVLEENSIIRKDLFVPPKVFQLSQLRAVEPVANWQRGVKLTFGKGRALRVMGNMSGYAQLLERLTPFEPKLALIVRMIQSARQVGRSDAGTS